MNVSAYNEGFAKWCKCAGVSPQELLIKLAQTRYAAKPLPTRKTNYGGAQQRQRSKSYAGAPLNYGDEGTYGDQVIKKLETKPKPQNNFVKTKPKVAPVAKKRTAPLGRELSKSERRNYKGKGRVTFSKGKAYEVL